MKIIKPSVIMPIIVISSVTFNFLNAFTDCFCKIDVFVFNIVITALVITVIISLIVKNKKILEKTIKDYENRLGSNSDEIKKYEKANSDLTAYAKTVFDSCGAVFNLKPAGGQADFNFIKENLDAEKIRKLGGIRDLLLKTSCIYHKIPYLNGLLSHSVTGTEKAAGILIDKYGELLQEFNSLKNYNEENSARFENNLGGRDFNNVVDESKAALEKHKKIIDRLGELNRHNKKKLDNIFEWLIKIKNTSDGIRNISDKNKIIAINSSIEAARLGEQGKSFRILAGEIRELTEKTDGLTKEIAGITDSFKKYCDELMSGWIDETEIIVEEINESFAGSENLIGLITDAYGIINDSHQKSISGIDRVESGLNDAIVSMQFQDIIRQQIDSVKNILTGMREDIHSCDSILSLAGFDFSGQKNDLKKNTMNDVIEMARHYDRDVIIKELKEV